MIRTREAVRLEDCQGHFQLPGCTNILFFIEMRVLNMCFFVRRKIAINLVNLVKPWYFMIFLTQIFNHSTEQRHLNEIQACWSLARYNIAFKLNRTRDLQNREEKI